VLLNDVGNLLRVFTPWNLNDSYLGLEKVPKFPSNRVGMTNPSRKPLIPLMQGVCRRGGDLSVFWQNNIWVAVFH